MKARCDHVEHGNVMQKRNAIGLGHGVPLGNRDRQPLFNDVQRRQKGFEVIARFPDTVRRLQWRLMG